MCVCAWMLCVVYIRDAQFVYTSLHVLCLAHKFHSVADFCTTLLLFLHCYSFTVVSLFPSYPSDPKLKKEYCSVELTDAKYKAFAYAIENHYWYQMYIGKEAVCWAVCVRELRLVQQGFELLCIEFATNEQYHDFAKVCD